MLSSDQINEMLAAHGIRPTRQRQRIAALLFRRCQHLSADQLLELLNGDRYRVSKATVYNTLGLFTEKGLVRQVVTDSNKVFYDSNTRPHHHLYNVDTGLLSDLEDHGVEVIGLPPLPPDSEVERIDVVVRVRQRCHKQPQN